jgi:hypothetical protein
MEAIFLGWKICLGSPAQSIHRSIVIPRKWLEQVAVSIDIPNESGNEESSRGCRKKKIHCKILEFENIEKQNCEKRE